MEDDIYVATTILCGIILVSALTFGIYSGIVGNKCAEKGWRDSKITITLTPYCINRTDQTDIIKPLKEI